MIRRRKIQARPNIATASSLTNLQTEIAVKSPAIQGEKCHQSQGQPAHAEMVITSANSPTTVQQEPSTLMEETANQQLQETITNDCAPVEQQQQEGPHDEQERHQIMLMNIRPSAAPNNAQQQGEMVLQPNYTQLLPMYVPSPIRPKSAIELPPLMRQQSHSIMEQPSAEQAAPPTYKKRKEAPQDKLCDTKKFTMADLVNWRPKTENSLRKKWSEKRKMLKIMEEEKATAASKNGDEEADEIRSLPGTSATGVKPQIGPRVKINEHGQLVVDEDSLVLVENPENNSALETINDDYMPKKLTSMSFKKYKKGSIWGILETDLFYEVLAATGTDFGLMHEFLSSRSRIELKQKFNREHRVNPSRIDETMRNPVLLDERLRQRVERMLEEMAKKN